MVKFIVWLVSGYTDIYINFHYHYTVLQILHPTAAHELHASQ